MLSRILVCCLLVVVGGGVRGQPLGVTSVVPANGFVGAAANTQVVLAFDAPVDAATVTGSSVHVVGRWSGVVPGTLGLDGSGTVLTFEPARPLFAAEHVTVSVASSVTSVSSQPLAGGFTSDFWVQPAAGTGAFTLDHVVDFRFPGEGLIRTYGFFAGDVDGDGSPDMSATNEVSYDVRVLLNDGCGSFGPIDVNPLPAGREPSPNEGADFNGDGLLDLATGNQNGGDIAIFLNDGAGSYLPPVLYPTGGSARGITVLDADADGDADVVASNLSALVCFFNDGSGGFTAGAPFDGGGSGEYQIGTADADNDGRPDLFVANRQSGTVALLLGDGAGGFMLSATRSTGGTPWALAVGDVDGDGNADVGVSNSEGNVAVVRGDGAGGLLPAANHATGAWPVSVDFADLEGDGDLDLTVGNFGSASCTVLFNDGTGQFSSTFALGAQIATSCSVLVDHDRDGDTDIIVTDELADKAFVYRQIGPSPAGVQAPGCDAALRVNGLAARAGFGGRALAPLQIGTTAFVGLSGQPSVPWMLAAGNPAEPGLVLAPCTVNLALDAAFAIVFDGFSADPFAVTDGDGESLLAVPVTATLPPGLTFTIQGILQAPGQPAGLALTNPERAVVTN